MRTVQWKVALMMLLSVSCAPTVQVDVRVPTAVSPLRSVHAARSIYSLAGSSKQYRQRPLSASVYYSFHQTL
jgi:hypothetical protein